MIQNERQYKVTQTKLRELEQIHTSIDIENTSLHPRQILSQKNSYNKIISTLKQEIAEYEELDKHSSMGIDRGLFQVPADFNTDIPADLLAAFEGEEV
jgi:hypothetical protein